MGAQRHRHEGVAVELAAGGWALLIAGAGVAGWVDAVIGGGGLVLIPLIMAVCPQLALPVALASNKLAAVSGTASAAVSMARRVRPPLRLALGYALLAAVCSGCGAALVSHVDKSIMRPVVIVLMLAVGAFVALRPSFGTGSTEGPLPAAWSGRRIAAVAAVALIASYDGLFGPGTGMFLIMAMTGILSRNFLTSAALAKVINTATNFGALVVFIAGGHMWWTLGLVLAAANIVGAQLGARTVFAGGTRLIRAALLVMVVVMSIYLTWQQISGQ